MFTVVATPTRLSLDDHFIKRPAATLFVTVGGDGMDGQGIRAGTEWSNCLCFDEDSNGWG